jgi:hypothetical protein
VNRPLFSFQARGRGAPEWCRNDALAAQPPPPARVRARWAGLGLGPVALATLAGCAGGSPLLHPAQTLARGDVRAGAGVSATAAVGSIGDDLRGAREQSASGADVPGAPGSNAAYARGALVSALVAPGLAPFVAARVGVGGHLEGGMAYTGRGGRVDLRRSVDLGDGVAFSGGIGASAAFYGRQQGAQLPGVDLSSLHGYGADIPLLVGWRSDAGLYEAWAGARGGVDTATIEFLTSEPASGTPLTGLSATRYWAGGLIGVGTGFRHLHVALEIDVAYQSIVGDFNSTHVRVQGVSVAPASALWWTF